MSWRGSGTSGVESSAPGLPTGPPVPTTRAQRAAGLAAIAGAILWPFGLVALASNDLSVCAGASGCQLSGASLAPLALSVALFAIGVAGLEFHAPGEIGLIDPIGDLSIGTAAVLLVGSALLGSFVLVGPAFLLLLIGSVIFGLRGWSGQRRSRFGSALLAIGIGTQVVFLVLATTVGTSTVGGFETAALAGLLMYAIGWAWLGAHLALGRPLVPAPYQEDPPQPKRPKEKVDRDR